MPRTVSVTRTRSEWNVSPRARSGARQRGEYVTCTEWVWFLRPSSVDRRLQLRTHSMAPVDTMSPRWPDGRKRRRTEISFTRSSWPDSPTQLHSFYARYTGIQSKPLRQVCSQRDASSRVLSLGHGSSQSSPAGCKWHDLVRWRARQFCKLAREHAHRKVARAVARLWKPAPVQLFTT